MTGYDTTQISSIRVFCVHPWPVQEEKMGHGLAGRTRMQREKHGLLCINPRYPRLFPLPSYSVRINLARCGFYCGVK